MWARFTVLSDTPIAAAIAGCAIPLSRNNTIWMRWRCAAGIFHRSAVFSRRTSALLHLTICSPESDGSSESHLNAEKQPVQAVSLPYPNRPDSRRYGAGIRKSNFLDEIGSAWADPKGRINAGLFAGRLRERRTCEQQTARHND